ncbi:flagellar basal body L-ring protein FlgH [Jannaschia sp. W003]|uniref:flagellar basal body L-ring protein FlgH n=1 Tax=Jannaschia sp. W003 TaxID=2867012 RepID=UPI0021A79CEF|nr:flagellar basal body L-ring protein FlgH [Jannaschia sp. W003]UWQ21832.1 flagellar basal body L-ring protein FlgH [Jannaschia sp. W003]
MIRAVLCGTLALGACGRIAEVGRPPQLTSNAGGPEHFAMAVGPVLPEAADVPVDAASLWTGGPRSLLGDRRAGRRGDILTVVISIDERAEFDNSSARSRSGSEGLSVPDLFGLPQSLEDGLPDGAGLDAAVSLDSSSDFSGDGSIRRKERLTLRVAATVVEVQANGVLRIEGTQEVRVNNEVRVLLVTGFVRPEDVTRQNEITYDKIASARISYGGRGQITDVQQPRYGQQVADILLPF